MGTRVQFFWDNFSKFFQEQCRKGEKHISSHLEVFWLQSLLEISEKKKRELASLGKNLDNFLEKCFNEFFCSQVTD